MSKQTKPSFLLGYWKPWKEKSNVVDSWLNYAKDVTLSQYTTDTIAHYKQDASAQQLAILNRGLRTNPNPGTNPFNRKLDIQIDQTRVRSLLKEGRLDGFSFDLGLKFYAKAEKNNAFYVDVLNEFKYMYKYHLTLSKLGMIYLYVPECLDPKKAFQCFTDAAKYLSVEGECGMVLAAELLYNSPNAQTELFADEEGRIEKTSVDKLTGQYYDQAALAAYILGDFELATATQSKAVELNDCPNLLLRLAKYKMRNGHEKEAVHHLENVFKIVPSLISESYADLDLNEPKVEKVRKDTTAKQDAKAEERRAMAVALEQEMKAKAQEARANVIEADSRKLLNFFDVTLTSESIQLLDLDVVKMKQDLDRYLSDSTISLDELETVLRGIRREILSSLDFQIEKTKQLIGRWGVGEALAERIQDGVLNNLLSLGCIAIMLFPLALIILTYALLLAIVCRAFHILLYPVRYPLYNKLAKLYSIKNIVVQDESTSD